MYIGKTLNDVAARLASHRDSDTKKFNKVVVYQIDNKADCSIAEVYFIAKYSPKYNIEYITGDVPTIGVDNMNRIITDEFTFNLDGGV